MLSPKGSAPRRIKSILIANRSEIAIRVMRAASEMDIRTVAIYSREDRLALHRFKADESYLVGEGKKPLQAYLDIDDILRIARAAKVDAIHPGYGFLSENPEFAEAVIAAGIEWVGPRPEVMRTLGNKVAARNAAVAADVPVMPATPPLPLDLEECKKLATGIGYPVMLKASWGGGGRGMRIIANDEELITQMPVARSEALSAFGNDEIYLEKLVQRARHVEVQILSDGETILHAGERDCSVQRRYQKVVEEAPAPGLSPALRTGLLQAATAYARHIGYRSLGTVEFMVDVDRAAFYFLEMNARIQVEHPVTEAITGLDLIATQIAIAEGRPLALRQDDITLTGHAIECRLNAEDIAHDFRPCPGRVSLAWFPSLPGLRVDTHMESGAMIPPHYDSMVAKLIAHGPTRAEALATMASALAVSRLEGVATNAPLHAAIMADAAFQMGGVDTTYLAGLLPRLAGGCP